MADDSSPHGQDSSPRWSLRLQALWPIAIVALVSAWSVVRLCRADASIPASDWQQLREALRGQIAPEDRIVITPHWLEPIGHMELAEFFASRAMGSMDLEGVPRVWEVGLRGDDSQNALPLGPTESLDFGRLVVRKVSPSPSQLVFSFTDNARTAKRSGASVGGVGSPALQEIGFRPYRCVLMVPSPGGEVRLSYSNVPLGSYVQGYVGLADIFTRRDIREPGLLRVEFAGRVVAEVEAGIDAGWVGFRFDTQAGRGDVDFVFVSPSKTAKNRRLCFAAEARQ